ncbi:hypothetical protein D3C81_1770400 [compost metagenome]
MDAGTALQRSDPVHRRQSGDDRDDAHLFGRFACDGAARRDLRGHPCNEQLCGPVLAADPQPVAIVQQLY